MGVFGDWQQAFASGVGEMCSGFKPNGTIHRFGKKDRLWAIGFEYVGKSQTFTNVVFGDWSEGSTHYWKSYADAALSDRQQKTIERKFNDIKLQVELEKKAKNDAAALKWGKIFESAIQSGAAHPYLVSKGLDNNFCGKISETGELLIPMYLGPEIRGVQRIFSEDGIFVKKFPFGVGKKGCSVAVNIGASGDKIFISEGFATAASISLAMPDHLSLCCFDAGNIYSVVEGIRKNSRLDIIICADLDKSGVGEAKAMIVCKAFDNVSYVLPKFPASLNGLTDFNDLHSSCGLNEIKSQLTAHAKNDHLWPSKNIGFTYLTKKMAKIRQYDHLYHYFNYLTGFKYIPDIQSGYKFNGKYYEPMHMDALREFSDINFDAPVKNFEREEFVGKCKARSQVKKDFLERQDAIKQINFNNGVLNLETMDLLPHSIKHPFTYVIPNDFISGVACPTWESLLNLIFLGKEHLIENLEEYVGFCLSRESYYRFNQALVLDGEGSNGKSTLINAIKMILGHGNCASASLAAMAQNRFLTHSLFKSMVNFCEEEPKAVFSETGIFKKLTGNSPMFAEEKNKSGFSFVNRSKIIISYNEMPYLGDETTGMRRRLLILPCEQDFENHMERRIDNVLEKIESELSGIIERCVRAYVRLSARGHFNINQETKDRFHQMRLDSNPVFEWWNERMEIDTSSSVPMLCDLMWNDFIEDTQCKSFTKKGFGKKISAILRENNKAMGLDLKIERESGGRRSRIIHHVKFKTS